MIFDKEWIRNFLIDRMLIVVKVEKKQLENILLPSNENDDISIIKIRSTFERLVKLIDRAIKDKALVLWNTINKLNPVPYAPRVVTAASSIIYETHKWKNNMKEVHNFANEINRVLKAITDNDKTSSDITGGSYNKKTIRRNKKTIRRNKKTIRRNKKIIRRNKKKHYTRKR